MRTAHRLPADIERTSMQIIATELAKRGVVIPAEREAVVLRVIHATADFDFAETLRFIGGAERIGAATFAACDAIVTDSNMALAGLSRAALGRLRCEARCFMAEPEIARRARVAGTTKAVAAVEYAASIYPGAVYAVGNAPTALWRLAELIGEGLRPALVVGVPVGFVNVEESKEAALLACEQNGVPAILAMGRKGGSTVAAAICNALLYTAADMLDPERRGWPDGDGADDPANTTQKTESAE